jgi:hypothetical protein
MPYFGVGVMVGDTELVGVEVAEVVFVTVIV